MEQPPPVNYVFIDFENIHGFDPGVIGARNVNLTLLVGAKQTKLEAGLVERLLEHAHSVQLVRLASSGRNALDFALAYYLGRAAAADPGGRYYIISRDKGFDPLVEHLNSRSIHASRHADISTLPVDGLTQSEPPVAAAKPSKARAAPKPKAPVNPGTAAKSSAAAGKADRMGAVIELLGKVAGSRPKKYKKLVSHLVAHLGKASNEAEVKALIGELQTGGHLTVDEKDAITYHLPPM